MFAKELLLIATGGTPRTLSSAPVTLTEAMRRLQCATRKQVLELCASCMTIVLLFKKYRNL
jgi:hypothetical protein